MGSINRVVLLAGALAGLASNMGRAIAGVANAKPVRALSAGDHIADSRNYGYRPGSGNRAHQRAALKKRNQARHRKACRG